MGSKKFERVFLCVGVFVVLRSLAPEPLLSVLSSSWLGEASMKPSHG